MTLVKMLVPYFGPLPIWFDVFLASCSRQKDIHFVFIGDCFEGRITHDNCESVSMSLEKFSEKTSGALGLDLGCLRPYKICDLKILLGQIFGDLVGEAPYWGHCDIDLVFGELSPLMEHVRRGSHDILSTYGRATGHLQIYRNSSDILAFLRSLPHLDLILHSERIFIVDEYLLQDHIERSPHIKWFRAGVSAALPTCRDIFHDGGAPLRKSVGYERLEYDGARCWGNGERGKTEYLYLHWLFWKKNFPWERVLASYHERGVLELRPEDYSGVLPGGWLRSAARELYLRVGRILYIPALWRRVLSVPFLRDPSSTVYPKIVRSCIYYRNRHRRPYVCY